MEIKMGFWEGYVESVIIAVLFFLHILILQD